MTEVVAADVVQAGPRPDPLPEGLKVGQPGAGEGYRRRRVRPEDEKRRILAETFEHGVSISAAQICFGYPLAANLPLAFD